MVDKEFEGLPPRVQISTALIDRLYLCKLKQVHRNVCCPLLGALVNSGQFPGLQTFGVVVNARERDFAEPQRDFRGVFLRDMLSN